MPQIHVLPKEVSELIAAGEVIERPASIVKELIENSIDAGSTIITVEIQNGGIRFIRITDNGCGIHPADVPTAFLRHATSKVQNAQDLDRIGTLGFRGEALASIAAVAKVEMMTKTNDEELGTYVCISGSEIQEVRETGCPLGTTITIRDIFYNVPARLKFLKKDVTEGNAVASIVDKIALSHPEISIKLIRDNKVAFHTPGDGKLLSAVYTIFGREFAQNMLPVHYELNGIQVTGLTGKPMFHRANRSMQHFFINGRYTKTRTCGIAAEEGYRGAMMVGKFPACVLELKMPFDQVDVNVHPAKIEVRFVNEKAVFDAVYFAVKSAVSSHEKLDRNDTVVLAHSADMAEKRQMPAQNPAEIAARDAFPIKKPLTGSGPLDIATPFHNEATPAVQETIPISPAEEWLPKKRKSVNIDVEPDPDDFFPPPVADARAVFELHSCGEEEENLPLKVSPSEKTTETALPLSDNKEKVKSSVAASMQVIGELFETYILAQMGEEFVIIDKHAAHERVLYNKLKENNGELSKQLLLSPVTVTLSRQEHEIVLEHLDLLQKVGFLAEDFGGLTVILRSVPSVAEPERAKEMFLDIAASLMQNRKADFPELIEDVLHRIACRSAVKAHDRNSRAELEELVKIICRDENVRYCPHGRPVMIRYTRKEIEKLFGRIV